jgi:hypothetical protein
MRVTPRRRRYQPLVIALYVNAALLACVLVAVLSRGGSGVALAAPSMPPIGGGGGVYMMPGQFSSTNWGCYLLDIDKQTLCAYEYIPSGKQLKLVAARYYRHDRDLRNYNTSPSPEEIERIVNLGANPVRGQDAGDKAGPATAPAADFVPKPSDVNNPG